MRLDGMLGRVSASNIFAALHSATAASVAGGTAQAESLQAEDAGERGVGTSAGTGGTAGTAGASAAGGGDAAAVRAGSGGAPGQGAGAPPGTQQVCANNQ